MLTLWTPSVVGGIHSVSGHLSANRILSREGMGYKAAGAGPKAAAGAVPTSGAADPKPVAAEAGPIPPGQAGAAADPKGPRSLLPPPCLWQQLPFPHITP
jgi:hypothetical protein